MAISGATGSNSPPYQEKSRKLEEVLEKLPTVGKICKDGYRPEGGEEHKIVLNPLDGLGVSLRFYNGQQGCYRWRLWPFNRISRLWLLNEIQKRVSQIGNMPEIVCHGFYELEGSTIAGESQENTKEVSVDQNAAAPAVVAKLSDRAQKAYHAVWEAVVAEKDGAQLADDYTGRVKNLKQVIVAHTDLAETEAEKARDILKSHGLVEKEENSPRHGPHVVWYIRLADPPEAGQEQKQEEVATQNGHSSSHDLPQRVERLEEFVTGLANGPGETTPASLPELGQLSVGLVERKVKELEALICDVEDRFGDLLTTEQKELLDRYRECLFQSRATS